jgi:hypothetical protein
MLLVWLVAILGVLCVLVRACEGCRSTTEEGCTKVTLIVRVVHLSDVRQVGLLVSLHACHLSA